MTKPSYPAPTPFRIQVPDATLSDLRQRLQRTRWAVDLDNEDEIYGLSTAYLKPLVDYWIDGYDWRAAEAEINQVPQFKVEIDGLPIHFMHIRGKGPNPMPLILSHGWPWTFWDWSKVIGPLTDPAAHGGDPAQSFDVVIPSLPGFGFSTPVTRGDANFWKMADAFHKLMTETLGYERYAAAGHDYGGLITTQLGHKYADSLYGINVCAELPLSMFQSERPWDLTEGQMVPPGAPDELREEILLFQRYYASHVAVHMLDAQTLTHGLNDSPAGMLAWILQRWRHWSDKNAAFDPVFTRDHVLTNATIYWVTESIGSSIRAYKNANRYPWMPSHDRTPLVQAPAGFTFLGGDPYPPGETVETRVPNFRNGPLAAQFNIVHAKAYGKGGHFAPWENPDAVIEGIRSTFGGLNPDS
ncbi:epoxide hydrolase family protein [Novosphingobium sp. P6W]|uniref:epoxide hydrolase family protein n=1 Tax=Novosphingobium sp. P6W TaxID=1609758 RepID=UPI0005C47B43|nr:epoxide hydrolase family protein [Novosphingobium sp. P6W]AXB78901.1 epoxide hydrolase [Novosphingobium sp. P6W]